ncbi:MAG: TraB/GumN family protein [Spirochaetaceae bacterium]|nr:TraB/GumN family protein [Spirochaetaceae bacterium]
MTTLIKLKNGDEINLIGTAHVSEQSVREVEEAINNFKPETVCIELDERRLANLDDSESWRKLDIVAVLKKRQGFLLLANLALSGYQRKIGAVTGSKPGEEMLKAVQLARSQNLQIALCDRDVSITLKRAWAKSSLWSKMNLLATLLASGFEKEIKEETGKEAIEKLKDEDNLTAMMNDLAKEAPTIKEVLIDERDAYLAKAIYQAKGRRLAVLGAGHLPGVEKILKQLDEGSISVNQDELNIIPKSKWYSKALNLLVPTAVIAGLSIAFFRGGAGEAANLSLTWILANGIPAAVGALLALAHPLSIVIAFLVAPFTTFIPLIGAGMVVALFEAFLKRPTVADMEGLADSLNSIKNIYKNRITRILLILILVSLGSSLGAYVGLFGIFSSL